MTQLQRGSASAVRKCFCCQARAEAPRSGPYCFTLDGYQPLPSYGYELVSWKAEPRSSLAEEVFSSQSVPCVGIKGRILPSWMHWMGGTSSMPLS